jgi:hypothetical protein
LSERGRGLSPTVTVGDGKKGNGKKGNGLPNTFNIKFCCLFVSLCFMHFYN